MAQARRKTAKARGGSAGRSWSGIGLLVAGMASGALAMQLWHGAQSGGVGIDIINTAKKNSTN